MIGALWDPSSMSWNAIYELTGCTASKERNMTLWIFWKSASTSSTPVPTRKGGEGSVACISSVPSSYTVWGHEQELKVPQVPLATTGLVIIAALLLNRYIGEMHVVIRYVRGGCWVAKGCETTKTSSVKPNLWPMSKLDWNMNPLGTCFPSSRIRCELM
jgi:hypothetical protein